MLQLLPVDTVTLILSYLPYSDLKGIGRIHPSFRSALRRKDFWRNKAIRDFPTDRFGFLDRKEYNDRIRYLACVYDNEQLQIRLELTDIHEQLDNIRTMNNPNDANAEKLRIRRMCDLSNQFIGDSRTYRHLRFGSPQEGPQFYSFDGALKLTLNHQMNRNDLYGPIGPELQNHMLTLQFPIHRSDFEFILNDSFDRYDLVRISNYYYFVGSDDQVYRFTDTFPLVAWDMMKKYGIRTQMDVRDLYVLPDDPREHEIRNADDITYVIIEGIDIVKVETENSVLFLAIDQEEYSQLRSSNTSVCMVRQ